jgi:predicted DNA-binding protein YlxM (UPF0122 family)
VKNKKNPVLRTVSAHVIIVWTCSYFFNMVPVGSYHKMQHTEQWYKNLNSNWVRLKVLQLHHFRFIIVEPKLPPKCQLYQNCYLSSRQFSCYKLAWEFSWTQLQTFVRCNIFRFPVMPRGKQLSPKTGGKIEALHSTGHSVRQIADFVQTSRNSVHQCLQRTSRGSNDYKKRDNATRREDYLLKRTALQNRRAPSRLLNNETGK